MAFKLLNTIEKDVFYVTIFQLIPEFTVINCERVGKLFNLSVSQFLH